MMEAFRAAWGFLTVFPGGSHEAGTLPKAYAVFPLVGVGLGAILWGVVWSLTRMGWTPLLVGAVTAVVGVLMTGGMHLDALADAVDGFYGGRTPEEIARIMRDPHVGAMGAVAVMCALMLQWAAFATLAPLGLAAPWLVIPALGRWVMVMMVRTLPLAGGSGIAGALDAPGPEAWRTATVCLAVVVVVCWRRWTLPVMGAALAVAWAYRALNKRGVGGVSGDTIGAAGVLAETAGWVVAAGVMG